MFCHTCGKEVDDAAEACPHCGAALKSESSAPDEAASAPSGEPGASPPQSEGAPQTPPPAGGGGTSPFGPEPKPKLVAGLLGIFLGWLGIHRFYLGYNTIGIIQLVLSLVGFFTCGITTMAAWVWGLVEGILILTGSINKDARGQPLIDQ